MFPNISIYSNLLFVTVDVTQTSTVNFLWTDLMSAYSLACVWLVL